MHNVLHAAAHRHRMTDKPTRSHDPASTKEINYCQLSRKKLFQ